MVSFSLFLVTRALAGDNVAGTMVDFNNDGMWSWYMDERAIIDPVTNKLMVSSVSSSPVAYPAGRPAGSVYVSTFDLNSGTHSLFQLSAIQEDDHNAAGLYILPNGKYIAMYSNHGNTAMGDYLSRYRISTNPHDSSSWTAEQTFNWQTVTGWNLAPNANNRVSYHNLFYLSADNGGAGRLYDFSRGTHQSANSLVFNQATNTWSWGGQLTQSSTGGYSTGYLKYASNGVDKIYFMSTETHPRNYNNNLWAGYISDGKTYKLDGTLVDSNTFDNVDTGGAVPDITSFTNVQLSDGNTLANPNANPNANNPGTHRFWTVDLGLDGGGNPFGLYLGRHDTGVTNPGSVPSTPVDHRLFYTRWDGTSWHNYEIARMGDRLYRGTDKSEEDYTGLGAVVPGDPNTLYISTPIDPRDSSGATVTPWYEIYKGVTSDGGADWNWTAITSNSSMDNLRPIVPQWNSNNRAVLWFRGTYTTAQNTDAAVVGMLDRSDQHAGKVHYVDATMGGNTTTAGGGSGAWSNQAGGNGGSLLASASGTGAAAATLKTSVSDLADGAYDIFAYFWADQTNDWRILAGPTAANLQLVRRNGSSQAEASQFDAAGIGTTSNGSGAFLYRTYIGRSVVTGGNAVNVFIDDFNPTANTRSWFDGIGYALVSIGGDFNADGIVNATDITRLNQQIALGDPSADLNSDSSVDTSDRDYMIESILHTHYGDADLNGIVDGVDLGALATHWMQTGTIWTNGDFNGDGIVNVDDLNMLALNWQADGSSLSQMLAGLGLPTSVPEPSIALFGLPLLLLRRRSRGGVALQGECHSERYSARNLEIR
ncbi:MAG TPA: dockerin type I domain-containing protein [Tepidisphaeraceae bacterium]